MEAETKAVEESFRRSLNAACLRSRTEQRMREVPSQAFRHIFRRRKSLLTRRRLKALEEAKETLLSIHEQQEEVLVDTSEAARAVTENLAMRQKKQAESTEKREKGKSCRGRSCQSRSRKRSERPRYWQDARREREREEKKRSLPDRRRETRPQPRWEAA